MRPRKNVDLRLASSARFRSLKQTYPSWLLRGSKEAFVHFHCYELTAAARCN